MGWLVMAALWGIVLAASPALAKGGWHKDPAKHLEYLTKKLTLTDEQRVQVEQAMTDYHSRAQILYEQLESVRQQKHARIKAVLSPEQQEKFERLSKKHHTRWWRGKKTESKD